MIVLHEFDEFLGEQDQGAHAPIWSQTEPVAIQIEIAMRGGFVAGLGVQPESTHQLLLGRGSLWHFRLIDHIRLRRQETLVTRFGLNGGGGFTQPETAVNPNSSLKSLPRDSRNDRSSGCSLLFKCWEAILWRQLTPSLPAYGRSFEAID